MRRSIQRPPAASLLLAALLTVTLGACSAAPGASESAGPSGSGSPSGSGGPSGSPAPIGSPSGFYLRAWQTQALEPHRTFDWLPIVTISNGTAIDGQIAVPAIYPGPLYVSPQSRSITAKGIQTIVDEARKDGLLNGKTDFTDNLPPGGAVGHLELVIDGTRYELAGDPTNLTRCRCMPDPGTAAAFASFWQRLTSLSQWIPAELGATNAYVPERLAVLTIKPVAVQGPTEPTEATWPLSTGLASFGSPYGSAGERCGVVSGADLEKLLPAVQKANQLTRFVDATGGKMSLQVRALVPGEPSPCAPSPAQS